MQCHTTVFSVFCMQIVKFRFDSVEYYYYQLLSINKTCWSNEDNFVTEDAMETASYFIHKDCLSTSYDTH